MYLLKICATFNGIPIKKTALIIREKTKKPKDPRISAEIFWLIIIHSKNILFVLARFAILKVSFAQRMHHSKRYMIPQGISFLWQILPWQAVDYWEYPDQLFRYPCFSSSSDHMRSYRLPMFLNTSCHVANFCISSILPLLFCSQSKTAL